MALSIRSSFERRYIVYHLPTYFHIGHTSDLYCYLDRQSSASLEISFERCGWADHFELQKLALHLAGLNDKVERLTIRCAPPDAGRSSADHNSRSVAVVEYANRMNFFGVLHKAFGTGLVVEVGDRSISATSEIQLQNDLMLTLPAKRWEVSNSKTCVPMQAVSDQLSVESLTKDFSTGAQVEELVEYYSELDFITSGEFATLVVHELMQNIVEHAWDSSLDKGLAAISLCTVELGRRSELEGRYQNRLRFAPEYERRFLSSLTGPGYLELCVSDTGMGVHQSLAKCPDYFSRWFLNNIDPSPSELVAAAFWAHVTRDPGPHRPGHRGLYYVAESIREHEGVLACQSGEHELSIVASDPSWEPVYKTRSPLAFTSSDDVKRIVPAVTGTHFRILLPLIPRRRRRRYWDLQLSPLNAITSLSSPIDLPGIEAAPAAPLPPEVESDIQSAMTIFSSKCRQALLASTHARRPLAGWAWVSCSGTRGWRKQHIHCLLEEITKMPSLQAVCLVNVPVNVFQPFVLVARHATSTSDGKIITLLDERGRRGLICRTYDDMHQDFMRWAVEGSTFQPDATETGRLLGSFVDAFKNNFAGLTFADLQFLMTRAGIEKEFSDLLESYRTLSAVAEIAPDMFVAGFIEFDEALRESAFLRAISSYVHLVRNYLLKSSGIIAVRRAATRLIEAQAYPDDRNLWIMSTPDPQNAPPPQWLLRHSQLCVLTDVVCRGETLQRLLADLALDVKESHIGPQVACISPLVVQLLNETGTIVVNALEPTCVPGISELALNNGVRVPIFSVLHKTAKLLEETVAAGSMASKPEPASNILFQPSVTELAPRLNGQISPSDFVRLAERERAVLLGHTSITGEHFDLEFNMLRLLRSGSLVLSRFCEQVAEQIVRSNVRAIVFPDESRIQHALPAIEEALTSRGKVFPNTIRLRRDESGDLFIRPADYPVLSEAASLLLLDDAINSGGTAQQMLIKTLEVTACTNQVHLQVLISRQSENDERMLSEIGNVLGCSFSYSPFVRIPVPFYSTISCAFCRAREYAIAVAGGLGAHNAVAAVLEDFANSLSPSVVYTGAPPLPEVEPALRYVLPSFDRNSPVFQQFTTLSGAKAAISCAIGLNRKNIIEFLDVTRQLDWEFPLAAFTVCSLFVRGDLPSSVLQSSSTEQLWTSACDAVSKAAADLTKDRVLVSRSACELCLACWNAPMRIQNRMFVDLIKLSVNLLTDTPFYRWLLFLAFAMRGASGGDGEINVEIAKTLESVRSRFRGIEQRKRRGLASVESLMRLRQLMQAFSGIPISEPWLDGVVDLLEILSYRAGHTRREYLTEDEVAWGESLLDQMSVELSSNAYFSGLNLQVRNDLWSEVGTFLDRSHPHLSVLSKSLTSSLGGWFRAVKFSTPTSIDIRALMDVATRSEKTAGQLSQLLDDSLVSYRSRHVDLLTEQLEEIVRLQRSLHQDLYGKNEGQFSFRAEVEKLLCPLYDLSSQYFPADLERDLVAKSGRSVHFEGSLFEYFNDVRLSKNNPEKMPRWCVLLAPRGLVGDILGDVLVENLSKHVLPQIPKRARVVVKADLEGIGSIDHRVRIKVSIFVNRSAWEYPTNLWYRTLGKNRDILLRVHGGDVHVGEDGGRTKLVVEFLGGHF